MNTPKSTLLALSLALTLPRTAGAVPLRIEVEGPRVTLGDLVPRAAPEARSADLGPAPAPGASVLIPREALLAALRARSAVAPRGLPEAVRVVRRMRALNPDAVERLVREAAGAQPLPRGATLASVHAPRLQVPSGWTSVALEVPRPPRRAGALRTSITLRFLRDSESLAAAPIPVEILLPPEAATPTVARNAAVTLVLRAGLVEVSTPAWAGADADLGDTLPVVLRPSGRVLPARLVAPDRAEALEAP
jgi:hypothetical protein